MDRTLIGRIIGGELARAQARWHEAARVVAMRWAVFLHSDGDSRRFAFASYVAALDAEEAAAADLAGLLKRRAAFVTAG
jgi:hypothetical protein